MGSFKVLAVEKSIFSGDNMYTIECINCGNILYEVERNLVNNHIKCECCEIDNKVDNNTVERMEGNNFNRVRLLNMLRRVIRACYNEDDREYKRYGAIGICVCKKWREDKEKFVQWAMDNGYTDDLYLRRYDNTIEYNEENCYFGSRKEKRIGKNSISSEFDYKKINRELDSILNKLSYLKLNITGISEYKIDIVRKEILSIKGELKRIERKK